MWRRPKKRYLNTGYNDQNRTPIRHIAAERLLPYSTPTMNVDNTADPPTEDGEERIVPVEPLETPAPRHHGRTESFHSASGGTPFFADVVMDLSEAHDLAETPDAVRPRFDPSQLPSQSQRIAIPSLSSSYATPSTMDPVIEENMLPFSPTVKMDHSSTCLDAVTSSVDTPTASEDHRPMSRITNFETEFGSSSINNTPQRMILLNPSANRRWPRDIPWAVSFCIFFVVSILWPLSGRRPIPPSSLAMHPLSTATIHALFWSGVVMLLLSRALYRTAGGGDGDDARHLIGSVLVLALPLSAVVHLLLALTAFIKGLRGWGTLLPLSIFIRDVYLVRRWRRRSSVAGSGSRQEFFKALTSLVLDILSRSLRRASFYRVLTALLLLQFLVLLLYRMVILRALGMHNPIMILVALVGFKWTTGFVARLLGLLASGGVMSWFVQQQTKVEGTSSVAEKNVEVVDSASQQSHSVTEAYRTVDASVYQSVADMDNVLDDDYEDSGDDAAEYGQPRRENVGVVQPQVSTVKSLLYSGISVSFGSVAHGALLGDLAQFVWSQIRKLEEGEALLIRRREAGFQGMQIGDSDTSLPSIVLSRMKTFARAFVKRHSDLAMSHVAAYQKSFHRAAKDVSQLIEDSGMSLGQCKRSHSAMLLLTTISHRTSFLQASNLSCMMISPPTCVHL